MPMQILSSQVVPNQENKPEVADLDLGNEPAPSPSEALEDTFPDDDHLTEVVTLEDDDEDFPDVDLDDVNADDLTEVKVYDLLTSFYRLNPEPSDEEIHALAVAVRMSPEQFEKIMFSVMSVMLEDPEIADEARDLL